MSWAALIVWIATAGGGFVLLSIWLGRGGMRQQQTGSNRIRPPLILTHFLLAATGLVLWIIYVATDSDALAWIAFVILAVVAASASRCSPSGPDSGKPGQGTRRPRLVRATPIRRPSSTFPSRSWRCTACWP